MLTPRQSSILSYLRQRQAARRPPPPLREIMAACSVPSTSTVAAELDRLEKAGHLKRERDSSRGLVLLGEGQSAEGPAEWIDPARVAGLEAEVKRLRLALRLEKLNTAELRKKLERVK